MDKYYTPLAQTWTVDEWWSYFILEEIVETKVIWFNYQKSFKISKAYTQNDCCYLLGKGEVSLK